MKFEPFIERSELEIEGNIRTVCGLFLGGCNLRCPYCSNYIINENPGSCESFGIPYVNKFLENNSIDTICFTGGEPLLPRRKKQFFNYIKYLKNRGYSIWLETNGYAHDMLYQLVLDKMIDYVSMDVKAPLDKQSYARATGTSLCITKIKKSIELILEHNMPHEFRTTLVPSIIDIEKISLISSFIKGARKYILQGYSPINARDPRFRKLKPFREDVVRDMVAIALPNVKNTIYRPAHIVSS